MKRLVLVTLFFASACNSDPESSDPIGNGNTSANSNTSNGNGNTSNGNSNTSNGNSNTANDNSNENVPDPTCEGPVDDGVTCTVCETLAPVEGARCRVTVGSDPRTLIRGDVLSSDQVFEGGAVLVSEDGTIECIGCNCAASGATVVVCPGAAVSPGLIDVETRASFGNSRAEAVVAQRYDSRNEWRGGLNGKPSISLSSDSSPEGLVLAQLRQLTTGVTAVVDPLSSLNTGVVRTVSGSDEAHGLSDVGLDYDPFPLGAASGDIRDGCDYDDEPDPSATATLEAYLPRIGGGVDEASANEVRCISSSAGVEAVGPNTLLVGTQALNAEEWERLAGLGAFPTWSPRSDVHTFGMTTQVTSLAAAGIPFALTTYLAPLGSRDLLSELACASSYNDTYLDGTLSDFLLWLSVTRFPSLGAGVQDEIGTLVPGHRGDVAIFAPTSGRYHRAVVRAQQQDLVGVFVDGEIRAGDADVVSALRDDCEQVELCSTTRSVCANALAGATLSALEAAIVGAPELFYCTVAADEGSCIPSREGEYSGIATDDDRDGDGIIDANDNCPTLFNPVRPVEAAQLDTDADGIGDACDACPTDTGTACLAVSSLDFDRDSVVDWDDNCPRLANPDQLDSDADGVGDACAP